MDKMLEFKAVVMTAKDSLEVSFSVDPREVEGMTHEERRGTIETIAHKYVLDALTISVYERSWRDIREGGVNAAFIPVAGDQHAR